LRPGRESAQLAEQDVQGAQLASGSIVVSELRVVKLPQLHLQIPERLRGRGLSADRMVELNLDARTEGSQCGDVGLCRGMCAAGEEQEGTRKSAARLYVR